MGPKVKNGIIIIKKAARETVANNDQDKRRKLTSNIQGQLSAGGVLVPKAGGGAGRWRAAVYEHQLVTPASAGCTSRICTRAEAIQVETNIK